MYQPKESTRGAGEPPNTGSVVQHNDSNSSRLLKVTVDIMNTDKCKKLVKLLHDVSNDSRVPDEVKEYISNSMSDILKDGK
jgi:hypothetical protein